MWLWLLASCSAPLDLPTAVATQGDLEVRIEIEGELAARHTVDIVNPIEGWSELDFLVEEGARVEPGDVVLRFKTEELAKELEEAEAKRDVALTQVEQAEARLRLQLGEARARIVQADLDRQMAEFRQTDSETVPRVERARAEIEAAQARLTTEEADTLLAKVEADARAEIEVLQLEVVRKERAIERLRDRLGQSEVVAPSPGVVLILERWGRETYRVGHEVYQGSTILQLPDLSELDVEAWVHEVDAPKVGLGQQARVTLDAVPGTVVDAEVIEVAPLVVPRGEEQVKHLGVKLALSETSERMKPGMTAQIDLLVDAVEQGVLLPHEAVFAGADGAFVQRPDGTRLPVVVVAEGKEAVAVEGIEAGIRVVTIDAEAWARGERPAGSDP